MDKEYTGFRILHTGTNNRIKMTYNLQQKIILVAFFFLFEYYWHIQFLS